MIKDGGVLVMSSQVKRRSFDRGYKEAAVRLAVDERRGVAAVARELGISANLLHRWKEQLCVDGEAAFPGKGHLSPDQDELRRLRRQLADDQREWFIHVTKERDIF